MTDLKRVLDELTTQGIDTDLLKETLVKNRKKIERIMEESDLQVTLYRLFAPVFGAGEARLIAKKILPHLPSLLSPKETTSNESRINSTSNESLFYALQRKDETIHDYLPSSFRQGVLRLASQPPITYLELNEHFFNISDKTLEALVKESTLEELFKWTTKRLLSWPKLYGEDEHDIYLFYFADFEEKHVMYSDDVVFLTTDVWDNIGIFIEWPINYKQLQGLNATSTILMMINFVFKHLGGIYEWKRLFSKIDKDAIIEADFKELYHFFVRLLQGELSYFLNPKDEDVSFSFKLESVHDFKYELGFRPERFVKTKDESLQPFAAKLMNILFHWKLFRWMGFRDEPHARLSKESFFDLFILMCRDLLDFKDVLTPIHLPRLDEIQQRCQKIGGMDGLKKALIEPIARELAYLVKIVTWKGGINQELTMAFRNGYLSTRIGKILYQIFSHYLDWLGDENGARNFLLYIYRVASEGLVSSDNMVIKKSLQYLMDIDEDRFGRSKNRTIKSDTVQTLLELHRVIQLDSIEDPESAQQWIKNTILQVHSFIHGARLFKILREGFKRFEERPLREIWGSEERKEIYTEIQSIFSRTLEAEVAQKSIKNLVARSLQEGFQKVSVDTDLLNRVLNQLPWTMDLNNQENLDDFINTLTRILHQEINPLLGRSTEIQEERVSFTDELVQAVTTENLIIRMYREHHARFIDIARNKSHWLFQLDDSLKEELAPTVIGGIIHLTLLKRPLKGDVQRIQTFEDMYELLETELSGVMATSAFQQMEDSEVVSHLKQYVISSVELWSNVFRMTDLINSFVQSQDFNEVFDLNVDEKSSLLQKPEFRSFLAQYYLRNWLSVWFNQGLDFAESIIMSDDDLNEDEEEDKIWEIVDAIQRIHFPQFLRWLLVGNTNYRLAYINELVNKYLQLNDTVIQAEFVSVYPEICMAFLVLPEEGAKNLNSLTRSIQFLDTECDIHFLKGGEIHSVTSLLTSEETTLPRDILKNVAALSILHGLELEAITLKLPSTSIYLTMSYHPRVSILTDVVGTTSIIVTKTLPLSGQVADMAPINAEVISGLYSLYVNDPLDNPIGKLVLFQRLRFTSLVTLKSLDFVKKLRIPSDLNLYEEMSLEMTTFGRNYEIWGFFRTELGKSSRDEHEHAKIFVKKIQFFGRKLTHFAYINQFFIAFIPLAQSVSRSLENSKTFSSTLYHVRNDSSFLSPVMAVFRSKDDNDDKRKVIVLFDNPQEYRVDLCVLWESDDVKEPYSINKARFVLESSRDRYDKTWKIPELATKTFNMPITTPFFDVTKKDATTGSELPETDLEKIESIALGGF